MREFKFRMWDKVHKQMISWEQYKGEMVAEDFSDDDLVVMEWTGLKDNKGIDIYEADIVRLITREHKLIFMMRVIFDLPNSCYIAVDSNGRELRLNNDIVETTQLTRIGNVFEHPELLDI